MLRPRWWKVVRDLWVHKSRTALVVGAIAIGIVGAGSVLNTWAMLRRVTRDGFMATNPASATIRTDSVDAALLARVRSIPSVGFAEARRTVVASIMAQGGWRTAVLFSVADFSGVQIGALKPESGRWPPADGALVIERSSVEFSAIGVGESTAVQIGSAAPIALGVTGIVRDAGLAPGWMEHVVYGFITPATLARLGSPSSFNQLQIVVRDRSLDRDAVRRVAREVQSVVEASGRTVADVEVPVPGRHIHAGQIDSLLYTQGAFGLLSLLLSGFLVVNLMTAMLAGQVREIGIMKSIGARSGQLARMYLAVALVLGLVASLVALPAAAVIGRGYAQLTADLLNFDTAGFSIPVWSIAVQLAVGALLPVAAAAVPVIRGCRISVSEALRDFGIAGGGSAPGWIQRRSSGLTRPLLLSVRNAFRRRQRMALTLVTLATGGAVYLGALNLRVSIGQAVGVLFGTMPYDVAVRFAMPHSADSIEAAMGRVPGVARAEAWGAWRAAVARPDGSLGNTFPVSAPPFGSTLAGYRLKEGRAIGVADTSAIMVNRRLMEEEPDLVVGATVSLVVNGRRSEWTVIGVMESGPTAVAITTREILARVTGAALVDRAVVATAAATPAGQGELGRRLREVLEGQGYEVAASQLTSENRRSMEDHLLMVADFLGLMSQLMIVVGGLGLASTISLNVLERTREIGVLRAIGARRGAILTIVQVEGLVIGILSWVLAVPLSVPMSVLLGRAFGRIMIPVPVHYTPDAAGVGRWLAVVVGVSVLACAWPAFRALRIPTARALSSGG